MPVPSLPGSLTPSGTVNRWCVPPPPVSAIAVSGSGPCSSISADSVTSPPLRGSVSTAHNRIGPPMAMPMLASGHCVHQAVIWALPSCRPPVQCFGEHAHLHALGFQGLVRLAQLTLGLGFQAPQAAWVIAALEQQPEQRRLIAAAGHQLVELFTARRILPALESTPDRVVDAHVRSNDLVLQPRLVRA